MHDYIWMNSGFMRLDIYMDIHRMRFVLPPRGVDFQLFDSYMSKSTSFVLGDCVDN